MNTEREQTYWDEWDKAALRRIIQQQRKITEASKKLEMKKLYQVLVVIDDPQLHKPHGALDTHTWVSSQKLRLISAAVRVNMQFLCCWRLRNQHELDADEELSACCRDKDDPRSRTTLPSRSVSRKRICLSFSGCPTHGWHWPAGRSVDLVVRHPLHELKDLLPSVTPNLPTRPSTCVMV